MNNQNKLMLTLLSSIIVGVLVLLWSVDNYTLSIVSAIGVFVCFKTLHSITRTSDAALITTMIRDDLSVVVKCPCDRDVPLTIPCTPEDFEFKCDECSSKLICHPLYEVVTKG